MKFSLFIIACSILLLQCSVSQQSTTVEERTTTSDVFEEENIGRTELIHLLRNKPGLQITNLGGTYEILIRGAKSISGPNAPLYVLDGVALGRSYDSANSAIDITQVASVRIITPSNAAIYGSRGQNGIIEIKTKK